ncbi:class I SAM-dependent methyltransferase [Nocardioides yefusunii]|uniref:Class I SAM-dependent methyltransferase n=1 Tax=Nocardioides yefusunii TaxID=2500546 RepID=A0ABW1QZN8_9ACTN|nr:methyltransferase [Nocardioides yefusunii]
MSDDKVALTQDHYFITDPNVPFERYPFTTQVWGHELTFNSGSGVFSRGHLDHATAIMLDAMEPPAMGQFLDLGCGYGPIGIAIAKAVPIARVMGVDVNERAVLLANENAKLNGVEGTFAAATPENIPTDYVFDEIWTNPPIRIGKEALHELLLTWLPRLAPGGRMISVVGKQLGGDSLQRWLTEQGWPTERLASEKRFRVFETRRASDLAN